MGAEPETPTASLTALPPGLLQALVERVMGFEAKPVAILVTGSYAAGTATPDSDLDLAGIYHGDPRVGYRTWFEERPGKPLHVSAGAWSFDAWVLRSKRPADWSFGFPTAEAAQLLWSTPLARDHLGDPPVVRRPAGSPELEDFVESAMKVKRALAGRDLIGLRLHAHDMAALAPRLLIPLNPVQRVSDRRDAVDAALSLPMAPEHYAADLRACLGLASVDDRALAIAALRLPRAMLAFLRERRPDIDPQPWLARYLADGTLERHLAS